MEREENARAIRLESLNRSLPSTNDVVLPVLPLSTPAIHPPVPVSPSGSSLAPSSSTPRPSSVRSPPTYYAHSAFSLEDGDGQYVTLPGKTYHPYAGRERSSPASEQGEGWQGVSQLNLVEDRETFYLGDGAQRSRLEWD